MVEKPACTNINELKKSLTIIKENKVFFMEAMMYRHHPQIKILIDLLNSNKAALPIPPIPTTIASNLFIFCQLKNFEWCEYR